MLERTKNTIKRIVIERLRTQDASRRRVLPAEFGGLPPRLWGWEIDATGHLTLNGLSAVRIAREFGTPLHVVNTDWLGQAHDEFLQPFQSINAKVRLATSYKTNPLPFVIRALHDKGTCAEVISGFELWLAERLGLTGDRIVVNGPGKTQAMIDSAVRLRAKVINIDGPGEIDAIAAAATSADCRQPVGVRVITSVGWSSQFGLSIAEGAAFDAFERTVQHQVLEPIGVHLHLGTGIKSVDLYLRAIGEVLEFCLQLKRRLGISIRLFDLGGGFGVPTVRSLDDWDRRMMAAGYPPREAIPTDCPQPSAYARGIADLFNRFYPAESDPLEIILEPGRAITSSAQTLLLSVVAVKVRNGKRQIILDGGKNITMPLAWETHKIFVASKMHAPHAVPTDIFGPLCHPGDIIAKHMMLPELNVGDVVAIMDAGAYFIPNQMNFSNPRPAVVSVVRSSIELVRRRESFDDIVRLDKLP